MSIQAYKLFRVRRDGTLGPLFIDRNTVVPVGLWMQSRAVRTPGFAYRPGWHVCSKKSAPHLSKKGRVWAKVWISGKIEEHHRPKSQGGLWYTAEYMLVDRVLGCGNV